MIRILVVEDSAPTRGLLSRSLASDGMEVTGAARLATGLERAHSGDFDVIVLDMMLPDGDGLTLCRELRAHGVTTPILCLTSRATVADRVQGFDAGADDYLKKPFALAELRARIRALARRRGIVPARVLEAGSTRIDFGALRLMRGGEVAPLTEREWRILELLAARRDHVVERTEILDAIWQDSGAPASDSLDVLLGRLRRKLGGPDADFVIRTIRGAGLVFESAR